MCTYHINLNSHPLKTNELLLIITIIFINIKNKKNKKLRKRDLAKTLN